MCAPDRDHLADWLAGWLDPSAAARTAAHVRACPACRAEADALARMATAVRAEAAHRAERVAVPAYRLPPPPVRRPVPLPFLAPTAGRSAPAAALRVAAGLTAAVSVAIGAVVWRAGSPPRGSRGIEDRRSTRDVGVAMPVAPTVVARQATAVRRGAGAVFAMRTPAPAARAAAAPRGDPAAVLRVADASDFVAAPPGAGPAATAAAPTTPTERDREPPDAQPSPPLVAPEAGVPTFRPPDPTSPAPPTLPTPPTPSHLPTLPATAVPIATPTAVVPTIAGLVIGADGGPLAGARIVVEPNDGGDAVRAVTGSDGRYAVDVAPGRWLVHAEADDYALMWRGGAPSPLSAHGLEVAEGAARVPVDFALEPVPGPYIRGRVVDAAGNGVPGALVVAARPGDRAVDVGEPAAAAFADGGGAYALPVPPGGWLVAATTDWRSGTLAWWGGDGSIVQADRVPVDVETAAEGIDVRIR